jgi:hypothetical protein
MIIAIIAATVVFAYATHHGKHYRRNRSRGLSMSVSMRGPWGTRISRRL